MPRHWSVPSYMPTSGQLTRIAADTEEGKVPPHPHKLSLTGRKHHALVWFNDEEIARGWRKRG